LRVGFCAVQCLPAILPQLVRSAPGIFTGLASLFMGTVLFGLGASAQTRCEENNYGVSHASDLCKFCARQRLGFGRCAKKRPPARTKPAGK